jgi:hypothetical protein
MTPGQHQTARVLAAALVAVAVIAAGLLAWEFYSLTLNDSATISETFWVLWAHQPGPIALVLATVSFWAGVLAGHFAWQSRSVYDGIRRREWKE